MWFILSAAAQPLLPEPFRLGDDPEMEQPTAADFDGDGVPEIVALDLSDVVVWSGRDPMTASAIPGIGGSSVTVGDFTGDGVPDLIAQDGLHVYGPDWPLVATYGIWVYGSPTDMDGDGDLDVVPDIGASWWENLGGGLAMSAAPEIGVPSDASCHPVDVNLDGAVDLACVEHSLQALTWYENDGTGLRFTMHEMYSNVGAWSLLPATPTDLDADGDLDLVFTEEYTVGNIVHGRLLYSAGDLASPSLFGAAVDLGHVTFATPVVAGFDGIGWLAFGDVVLPLVAGALGDPVSTLDGGPWLQWLDWDGDGLSDEFLSSGSNYSIVFDGFATGDVTAALLRTTAVIEPIAAVDIDGDGDDDISLSDGFLLRTDAWGRTFATEVTGFGVGAGAEWSDFDQDGLLDTLNGSTLLERDADGGWSTSSLFTLTGSPYVLSTQYGDLDGDGDTDVVTFQDDGTAAWLDDGGTWTRVQVDLDHANAGAVGDLDGDGDLDLVSPTVTGERWYENRDGIGTLWVERVLSNDICGSDSVHVDDLDGDGDNDVWMSGGCGRLYERTAFGFTKFVIDLSDACVLGDLDLDGDLDFVTVGDNFVGTVWLERRSSVIDDLVPHDVDDAGGVDVALLDLEGDGDQDVAVSTYNGIELFRNSTLTPPDDPDSDGFPDVADGCPLDWDPLQVDEDGDGATDGCDCAAGDPTRHPGAPEVCQALDDDCDGATDEDFDLDLDGVATCGADGLFGTDDDDCADGDPKIAPGLPEIQYNGVDDDCAPETLDDDLDRDGYAVDADCDDLDRGVNPGLIEIPYDGRDNDCDGATFDDDLDRDGFGIVDDCDDGDVDVNPGEIEVPYDGTDQDCDDATPDDDLDNDGFDLAADCDDGDRFVNPGRFETPYDGVDNDCDPTSPDDDLDGDGALLAEDCDDGDPTRSELLAEVVYDGVDNDCDPTTPDDDLDGDGAPLAADCDDSDPARSGGPELTYDGIDNDCDPTTLDDDLDGDGAPLAQDCDDADPTRSGLTAEIAYDGIDNDCDLGTPDDDLDGDGFGVVGDCDDSDPTVGPPPCAPPPTADGAGCGCQEGGAATGGWLASLLALLVRRRRRSFGGSMRAVVTLVVACGDDPQPHSTPTPPVPTTPSITMPPPYTPPGTTHNFYEAPFLWVPIDLGLAVDLGQVPAPVAAPVEPGPVVLTRVSPAAGFAGSESGGDAYGVGVAFVDVDGDGWDDLFVANGGDLTEVYASSLWRNQGDGTFVDVTASSGIGTVLGTRDAMSVAAADLDSDGDVDLFVASHPTDVLLVNAGDGTFTDGTAAAGAGGSPSQRKGYGSKIVSIGDYDGDGILDLASASDTFVVAGHTLTLLHGLGGGTFEDVSAASGLASPDGTPCAVLWSDHDADGLGDLVVWSDLGDPASNRALWVSDGSTFVNVASEVGWTTQMQSPMGIDAADVDRDGTPDYFVGDGGTGLLLLSDASGRWVDWTIAAGIDTPNAWGLGFEDLDADRWWDLFVGESGQYDHLVFRNERTDPPTFSTTHVLHTPIAIGNVAVGFADVDHDGDVDFASASTGGETLDLYRNDTDRGTAGFLEVRVTDAPGDGATGGVSARVVVSADGLVTWRDISGGSSRGSQNALSARFGLGQVTGADWVAVVWPDGRQVVASNVAAGLVEFSGGGATWSSR